MNIKRLLWPLLPCVVAAALATVSHAAVTDIAQVPLVTSAPNAVLPNLMFILDDSGSMDSDYLPDWANDSICRQTGATFTNSGTFSRNCTNEPPFRSPSFNGVYYNPAITYNPPLYSNGTSWPSQTSANTSGWTNVRNDAYNVQSSGNTNLITGYADVEWCTDTNYTDCLRNGNYVLPGTVNGKSYTSRRATTATGSGYIAVDAPDAAKTEARTFGAHYYAIEPAEYCDALNLRNCQATATAVFKFPAPLRWCNSNANAIAATPAAGACQALRTETTSQAPYPFARFPTKFFTPGTAGTPIVPAVPARTSFDVALSSQCRNNPNPARQIALSAVTVNGINLLGGTSTGLVAASTNLAAAIRNGINANTGTTGYSADSGNPSANNRVRIFAPVTAGDVTYSVTFTRTASSNATCTMTAPTTAPLFSGFVAEQPATLGTPGGYPGKFVRTEIIPSVTSYPRASSRTDCGLPSVTTCTYDQEMTNFANWFTYYRTRMQTMKSSASFAFGNLSNRYRLGYLSINNNTGSDFLNFDRFELTQKDDWFTKLTKAKPNNATPLRGALSTVGRLYGGKLNDTKLNGTTVVEPMQYSCQQNFTLLSTDGYWNETAIPLQLDGSTEIGDVDSTLARPLRDGNATSNTLADVAAYYYNTDLRDAAASGVCVAGSGGDLCENNVPIGGNDLARHQHMTTFTLGLGVSGYMLFDESYASQKAGDFFDVANGNAANPTNGICTWQTGGTCEWPIPLNNSQPAVDDLWHAAVNGRGTYFSAKDPATLYTGLANALAAIEARRGAAAAATTSNPNISAGDDAVFISRFFSGPNDWSGELNGQKINTDTGAVMSSSSDWSANDRLAANTSRSIYTFDASAGNKLKPFTWSNLNATEQAYFVTPYIKTSGRALSQFCSFGTTCLDPTNQTLAEGALLVNYLRGDRTHEGPLSDISKYYRPRLSVRVEGQPPVPALLGDIVNSEALYVKKALYNYADSGYSAFKTAVADRRGMVYVGANDGMLHAFDASNGDEVWAYIPTMMMPKLYRLADKNYGSDHQFFVDGSPISGDVSIGGAWKTILVGGLGAGGRGYYALDVTDPDNPKALWEYTNDNLGLSFGKPEITKLKNGTWVVIFASGYNNISPGDGLGRLFVLDAATGAPINTITTSGPSAAIGTIETSAGSTSTPSGLAHIRAWVDRTEINNTALRVYGGDNLGNVWRFDVNNDIGASGYDAQLLATLRDKDGNAQPVTARPELGLVSGKAMVYVGTGRYLGVGDLTDAQSQTMYAIKDSLGSISLGNPRSASFVAQTLSAETVCPKGSTACVSGQTVRLGSNNPVDLATNNGWYIDLPVKSERANTDPQLALGTLVFTTNVVKPDACTVGGISYINFVDYRTGGTVTSSTGVASALLGNALATRPTIIRLPTGKVVSLTRLSDDRTVVSPIPVGTTPGTTRRISWRELAN